MPNYHKPPHAAFNVLSPLHIFPELKSSLYPSNVLHLERDVPLNVLCFANITRINDSVNVAISTNSAYDRGSVWNDVMSNISAVWYDVKGRIIPKEDPSRAVYQSTMIVDNVMTAVLMGKLSSRGVHVYRCDVHYHLSSHQSILTVNISGKLPLNMHV